MISALAGWALIWWLATRGIRPTPRSLLAFEAIAVLLRHCHARVGCPRRDEFSDPRASTSV